MRTLIYDSIIFRGCLRAFSWLFLRLGGWTVTGAMPDLKKFVGIAAPHTSNWDFPIFLSVAGHFNIRVRFLGKHTLFKGPFGWLFYYLGGIPVNRESKDAGAVVEDVIEHFNSSEKFLLGMSPEGTRSSTNKWKTGFYRIAVGAGVPILLAYVDSSKKEVGFGPMFYPTGDMEADMPKIMAFYDDKEGINPSKK